MLTYTVCSVNGGTGQTTLAWNLAAAHAHRDRDVLAVDLSAKRTGLTAIPEGSYTGAGGFGDGTDSLVDHLLGEANMPVSNLIRQTSDSVDIIPATPDQFNIDDRAKMREAADADFELHRQLKKLLRASSIREEYDTIIIDANPRNRFLSLALTTTKNIVVPCQYSPQSEYAIKNMRKRVRRFEDHTGVTVRTMILAPTKVGYTTIEHKCRDQITALDLKVLTGIRDKPSLFDQCWKRGYSLFEYADAEEQPHSSDEPLPGTLDRLEELAKYLEEHVELEPTIA